MAKDWSPDRKWVGWIVGASLLAFGTFVGVGATKGYQASDDIQRIEKKEDARTEKESQEMKQWGKFEATLEIVLQRLENIENKIDKHMEQKPFDRRH